MNAESPVVIPAETDDGYPALERLIARQVAEIKGPLFATDATGLFDLYLSHLPADRRQHYNCHACRRFVETYGGLVTIDPQTGGMVPTLWSMGVSAECHEFFAGAVTALRTAATKARVTNIFLSPAPVWGTPENTSKKTGIRWFHLSGTPPQPYVNPLKTAAQAMAEKREEHGMLCRGLIEYPPDAVAQAVRVLQTDALSRGEKTLGVALWLFNLHVKLDGIRGPRRNNLIWAAVATAPPGWCHIRTTMIATLLDDIVAGLPFEDIARRWAKKMHPLQYQRPTAAPKAGAIDQAEKLVATLGVAKSLERRFARLEDVQVALWMPPPPPVPEHPKTEGVFDHLRPARQQVADLELPATTITWDKFRRTVLPTALAIEARLPTVGPFYGLVTAADPQAPPILQWDGLEGHPRNPVSSYIYYGGSPPQRWNLRADDWAAVTAVFLGPHHWQDPSRFAHHGETAFFALAGCWDSNDRIPLCLFPEILKAEFHGIRAVIEAHSNKGGIQGAQEGTANGLLFGKQSGGRQAGLTLRVRTGEGTGPYVLDRWD